VAEIDRKTMERALKDQCVPTLRQARFKGSFPNFYREDNDFVALVNFQFSLSGGSFCVNLSYTDRRGRNLYFRPDTKVRKLSVSQTTERLRLSTKKQGSDNWYSFGRTSYGEFRGDPLLVATITANINDQLRSQAEQWWADKRRQA
jgi:hypothetical protein